MASRPRVIGRESTTKYSTGVVVIQSNSEQREGDFRKKIKFFCGGGDQVSGDGLNSLTKGVEREHDRSAESYVVSSR